MPSVRWLLASVGLVSTLAVGAAAETPTSVDPDMSWWSRQHKGANCQNESVEPEYWKAAAAAGIEFIRLAPDAWPSAHRDFLIGDADAFETLVPEDLQTLRRSLDDAHDAGVGVVLTCFSLPGARWRQLNGDEDDYRLWNEPTSRDQALAFWTQLATALHGHPAVVAYNPLNEPHPERQHAIGEAEFHRWSAEIEGTLADVNRFNREMVAAIRQGDATTPILLDGGFYASPFGLSNLSPVDDPAVLYAFHFYDPWEYVTYRVNNGRFEYPEAMPGGWSEGSRREALASVAAWTGRHHIDSRHIVLSEFGCDRRVAGAAAYLDDLLTVVARWNWHWAFYAFRGDGSWGGLDYELGVEPFGGAYWAAVERGEGAETLKDRGPNPLWDVLSRRLLDPCAGHDLTLGSIREQDRCRIAVSAVGAFPAADDLTAEIVPLSVRSGGEVRFPLVYRNTTDGALRVDLFLLEGAPASSPSRVLKDGKSVDPPPSCVLSELALAEGRRVTLLPGGTLTLEAVFVARPGGDAVWPGLADSCDVKLPPGDYTLEVRAPSRDPGLVDVVQLTVTR